VTLMALIKLGPEIIGIRGKCGGNIFKRDSSGQHIHAKARKVHRQDIHHSMTRSQAMSALSLFAVAMMAAGYLILWVTYASTWLWKNKQGDMIKLTWWNWYMHFNLMRIARGEPPLMVPPIHP